LRSSDFRRVYQQGAKISSPFFVAFCAREEEAAGARIGLTVPRALGTAVVRNRIKRRMREAIRLQFASLSPEWSIVINPRKTVTEAPFGQLRQEVERLFRRCKGL
jgi:ribonuclease P protein component